MALSADVRMVMSELDTTLFVELVSSFTLSSTAEVYSVLVDSIHRDRNLISPGEGSLNF